MFLVSLLFIQTVESRFIGGSMSFAKQQCSSCEGGVDPYTEAQAKKMLPQIPLWNLITEYPLKISRTFTFKNFAESLAFVNQVGEITESQGHHPDIFISWNKVTLTLYTYAIQGLSLNDFIIAARVDNLDKKSS
jgi:4a-hydroxytetrahydrobiopterin dehydratase